MAKTYKIAVIPGDGIGKEVTPWAQKALEKAAEGVADFEYENFDLGAERYLRDGKNSFRSGELLVQSSSCFLSGAVISPRRYLATNSSTFNLPFIYFRCLIIC